MYRVTEIKRLLQQHDYAPVVRKCGDGIVVHLPYPKLTGPKLPRVIEAYQIKRGPKSGLFYNANFAPDEKFVSVPEHAIRLFLMSDISVCCGRIPISDMLVCYIDEEGHEHPELEDVVRPPSTRDEQTKEGFLTRLFMQAREDGFPQKWEEVAATHGVHAGFRLIKSFFEG